jgi:hypothetical protein
MWWNICNLSTQEAEVGGSRVRGPPGLHNKTVSKNKTKIFLNRFSFNHLIKHHSLGEIKQHDLVFTYNFINLPKSGEFLNL